MAGDNPQVVRMDPAVLRYADMMNNRYKYFRWTRHTAWINFVYVLLIPSMIGTAFYYTDGKYNFRGKRRDEPITEF